MIQKNFQPLDEVYSQMNMNYVAKQVITFLDLYAPEFVPELGEYVGNLIESIKNKKINACISCKDKKEKVFCPYCFTEKIHEKLKKLKADEKVIEEFELLFNLNSSSEY